MYGQNNWFNRGGHEFIVCRHQAIPKYARKEEYEVLMSILKQKYPLYYDTMQNIYGNDGSSARCNAKNMFVTTGKELNEYCTFLFDVLFECRKQIGDVERKNKRYNALFAERLFTVYLITNKKRYKEVDIKYDRKFLTFSKIIINRLPFHGNSKLLSKLRPLVYKGSWRL